MIDDDFLRILKLVQALQNGSPADLMRVLPIEGGGKIAEVMKMLPSIMQGNPSFFASKQVGTGRDAEIYRLSKLGTDGVRAE